jgi:hypothetical protein
VGALERRIETGDFDALASAWQDLARRAARSPFESPAWLLSWLRWYGSGWQPCLITWWRGSVLVGVAPICGRRRVPRGVPVRELTFWGRTETPLRGWVDVVADDAVREEVAADFVAWLAGPDRDWDLFHYLHLAPDSPTVAALADEGRRWRMVDLSGALHSLEYDLSLPEDAWRSPGPLGPKARHEIRREIRLYQRRMGGRVEEIVDPDAADELVAALASLLADRWGEREAYFRRDPRFGAFAVDALRSTLGAGASWALVARDPRGIAGCLVILTIGQVAVAILTGVTREPEYGPLSLGKCLFYRAIEGAALRGCRMFSFLTEDGYKEFFWHAEGRPTESGFLARGGIGLAIAAYVTARRIVPRRVLDLLAGRRTRYRL